MHKDFHLYGTYTAAKIAGLEENDARVVAFAAQMVDDFTENIVNKNNYELITARSVEGMRDYWNVYKDIKKASDNHGKEAEASIFKNSLPWILFHFIPGYLQNHSNVDADKISEKEGLLCGLNGPIQKGFTSEILKQGRSEVINNYIALGIAMHILSDVYAHYGFSGLITDKPVLPEKVYVYKLNGEKKDYTVDALEFADKVIGLPKGIFYGHAKVGELPDISTAIIEYKYKDGTSIFKDNKDYFSTAFVEIIAYIHRYNGVDKFEIDKNNNLMDAFADKWYKIMKEYLLYRGENKDDYKVYSPYNHKNDQAFRKLQDMLYDVKAAYEDNKSKINIIDDLKDKLDSKLFYKIKRMGLDIIDIEQITSDMISSKDLEKAYNEYLKRVSDVNGDECLEFLKTSQLIKHFELGLLKNSYTGGDIDIKNIIHEEYGK